MTFEEFIATRENSQNVDPDGAFAGEAGYTYTGGFFVIATLTDDFETVYVVPTGRDEPTFSDLTAAERFLWKQVASAELNSEG